MHTVSIAAVADLKQKALIGAEVGGVSLVAVACQDGVSVFEGLCPHRGTLLAEGQVDGGQIVCRGHGWQFRCATGGNLDPAQPGLHQFSVVVADGQVLVDEAEVAAWAAARAPAAAGERAQPSLTPDRLPGPPGLPVLGILHQLRAERFHLTLEDWHRQYGDLYQFRLGGERAVVVADPEQVQAILLARPERFARLRGIRETIEEMGVQGLFSAEGEQWRRHRRVAARAFDVSHLIDFFPTLTRVTERLLRRWQRLAAQGAAIDVQEELMRYTVDVTANLAFGYDMNTLAAEGDRIQQHLERVFPMIAYRAFMPVRHWNYFKLPADRALEASLAELRAAVGELIENARAQMRADPALRERPRNLLQALLAAQAGGEVPFSDLEIYGSVLTFLLAGEDTTANTMAWMLFFMAEHPAVQRRMQAEAESVLGDAATVGDYAQARALDYVDAVAQETMRLKPVATFLGLQALADVTIGPVRVPQGTPVFVLLRPKGLEDGEFADALQFRPERWLDYAPHANPRHRKSFSPFGGGPRLCPGRSLALLEIKLALSTICRHFDVARAEPERAIKERFVFTMMPENLHMSLRPRVAAASAAAG